MTQLFLTTGKLKVKESAIFIESKIGMKTLNLTELLPNTLNERKVFVVVAHIVRFYQVC